ncbi:transmembrane proteins 14C-domain-containing protein [Staphylotrichum tortipilum]|uniref:Transmembrane proteins 14C-domain-containing protein n=1 Tax=Staphylotrichum tortipilum TaxID=2831512 RepID=A0AAN6RR89_9PEZI|nr:transmembrane proteins 14C-domain-containing protein [Staphylotrichum longicolle]
MRILPLQGLELPSYVLAALTAAGGAIGYARTKSRPSVIAGTAVGLLYGLGGYRISNSEPYGVELSLLASVVLGGASVPRAIRLRKPVPIMLSLIAAYGLVTFGDAYRKSL